jgi:glycosyltransferase involved in cell wall biosynthesis
MRIHIWHGYLLDGTGSNVYTRMLARVWGHQGHEVMVFAQDPDPDRYDLGGARVVRPSLPGRLPVFVLDRYPDLDAVLLGDMAPADRDRYVAANADAIRAQPPADLLLVNHVLLGGPVGAATGRPYAVKAHGSELEYAIRGNADLADWARRTLEPARAVLAGSQHVVGVLDEVVGHGSYSTRVHVVPPGVDTQRLRPRTREEALASLVAEARLDPAGHDDERLPDPGNADRLAHFLDGDAPVVLYVGKLSAEKGVDLLVAAARDLDAKLVVVGFGPARAELERTAGPRTLFTGPLEHRHLAHLWPLARVAVTPSVFPEAFGMVAAEAASCGCPPLVARHSGLAEIAERLETAYPPQHRDLAAFTSGDGDDLRRKLEQLLGLPDDDWRQLSLAARRTAQAAWSWDSVADRIVAAAAS